MYVRTKSLHVSSNSDNEAGPGVLVTGLEDIGLARLSGLRVGDMLLAVNGAPVDSHGATIDLIKDAEDELEVLIIPGNDEALEARLRQLHLVDASRPLGEFEA